MPDGSSRGLDESADAVQKLAEVILTEKTLEEVLDLVVDLAERTLDVANAASVSIETNGKRVTAASSEKIATDLDELQYKANEGPCIDAMTSGEETLSFPLEEGRWKNFAPTALANGVNGMYSLPLHANGDTIGALNLYSKNAEGPVEGDRELGRMFARQAAVVVANSIAIADALRLSEQLQQALQSREVIGQAKGILMLREGYGHDEAFDALRKMSQHANVKLRDVAQQLVESVRKTSD